MKRVYLILTLFMTSFFLLFSNVSADTIIYEPLEEHIEVVKTEEFKLMREKLITFCNENNKNYYITYYKGSLSIYIVVNSNRYLTKQNDSIPFRYYAYETRELYEYKDGELKYKTNYNNTTINFFENTVFTYRNYIDSNFPAFIMSSDVNFTIKYKDLSYEITDGSNFPSVYQIYSDYEKTIEVPDEVDPKAEIVTNFYVLVIDKIKLLTNYIATDYIILSALVIFIFVAVIGLVRRLK